MAVWDLIGEPFIVCACQREVGTFEPLLLLQLTFVVSNLPLKIGHRMSSVAFTFLNFSGVIVQQQKRLKHDFLLRMQHDGWMTIVFASMMALPKS